MILFENITDYLKYPPKIKGIVSVLHNKVISYAIKNYEQKYRFRKHIVDVLNSITFAALSGDYLEETMEFGDVDRLEIPEDDVCKKLLGHLYLSERSIEWPSIVTPDLANEEKQASSVVIKNTKQQTQITSTSVSVLTSRDDLSLKPPIVPQFDTKHPYIQFVVDTDIFVIYPSLPTVPTRQCEISVTTDVNKLTESDYLNLFPKNRIQTRAECMYRPVDGLDWDERLGVILPISGFSYKQLRDNIVRYPHLFKLYRVIDGQFVSFHSQIELAGTLHKTMDVWDSLPESKLIPRNIEFIKEYVIRRYLLERDVKKVKHTSNIYGDLSPFLTLYTTQEEYRSLGYNDGLKLAQQCVESRIMYKKTRNPILRRFEVNG